MSHACKSQDFPGPSDKIIHHAGLNRMDVHSLDATGRAAVLGACPAQVGGPAPRVHGAQWGGASSMPDGAVPLKQGSNRGLAQGPVPVQHRQERRCNGREFPGHDQERNFGREY